MLSYNEIGLPPTGTRDVKLAFVVYTLVSMFVSVVAGPGVTRIVYDVAFTILLNMDVVNNSAHISVIVS